MSPQVTITHSDGTTDTISSTASTEDKPNWALFESLSEMDTLTVRVDRDNLDGINLERKRDDVELSGVFEGRLTDINRRGTVVSLTVDSFEWLALNSETTRGGLRIEGDVDNILQGLIDKIDGLTAGTLEKSATGLTFVFNHAFPGEGMRRVEKNVPGNLRFNSNKTVDFLDPVGEDKTETVEISTVAGTVDGEPEILEQSRSDDATHLKVIGAHEGEAQIFANVVPESDTDEYENRVNYTNPDWSDGDPMDWDRYENADVMSQETIEEEGLMLIQELQNEFIKVRVPTVDHDGELGDTVTVDLPDVNVMSEALRIVEMKTEGYGPTERKTLTLSSRNKTDEAGDKWKRDAQRFNTAFQGATVWGNFGGSRDPVNPNNDYEIFFQYPNIEYEHEVELLVRGLPYRAYSSGSAAGAGEIGNETPLDVSVSGDSAELIEFMQYPNTSQQDFDPLLYAEGDGEDRFSANTVQSTDGATVTHEKTADSLNIVSDVSDSGDGLPEAGDGSYYHNSRIDMSEWNTLEVDWAADFVENNDGTTIVSLVVGEDTDGAFSSGEQTLEISETDHSGGFARKTDSMDISGINSDTRVRLHSYAETPDGGDESTADLDVFGLEVKE